MLRLFVLLVWSRIVQESLHIFGILLVQDVYSNHPGDEETDEQYCTANVLRPNCVHEQKDQRGNRPHNGEQEAHENQDSSFRRLF